MLRDNLANSSGGIYTSGCQSLLEVKLMQVRQVLPTDALIRNDRETNIKTEVKGSASRRARVGGIHRASRVLGVLFVMFLSVHVARADYILTADPFLRIQEGQIGLLSIQATNTSSFPIQVDEFGVQSFFELGDTSDGLTVICCGPSPLPVINPNQTLTYFVNIGTTFPPPNDNADSGFWGLEILGDAYPVGNLVGFVPVHSSGSVVEVYDSPVPEPSSLLLSFSGE